MSDQSILEPRNSERAVAQAVDACESFADLVRIIEVYGPVEGSTRTYPTDDLVSAISAIKLLAEDHRAAPVSDLRRLPRSLGLRKKCEELHADQTAVAVHKC